MGRPLTDLPARTQPGCSSLRPLGSQTELGRCSVSLQASTRPPGLATEDPPVSSGQ